MKILNLRLVLLTAVAALASACGADAYAPDTSAPNGSEHPEAEAGPGTSGADARNLNQSGTRIKARVLKATDGTKQFLGWRDTQLGIDCEFLHATDGSLRCLPTYPKAFSSTSFADSACTLPIFRVRLRSQECPQITHVVIVKEQDPNCSVTPRRHEVRALGARSLAEKHYYRAGDACVEHPADPSVLAYEVGPEVDPHQYEEASVELE